MSVRKLTLEGIIPALHTAYDGAGEIAEGTQRAYLRRLLGQGVPGVFACGTSAEFPFLTVSERERLTELAAEECRGKAVLVVHVGGPSTREVVHLARHAERSGAAAVSAVPPYYFAYDDRAVLEHVKAVTGAVGIPFIYYHIPERTGFRIDERFFEKLVAIEGVAGMKYSSGDLVLQERLQNVGGPGFKIYCGSDETFLPAACMGACGAIGSTYNFLAPLFLNLWRAIGEGNLARARSLQLRANRVITELSRAPGIAGSKEALRALGVDLGDPRPPQANFADRVSRERFASALVAAGLREAAGESP